MRRPRYLLVFILSLLLLVNPASGAWAAEGQTNNGVITPRLWASSQTYDWYKALDILTERSKREPQTFSYTFTVEASVVRLSIDNDGVRELDVAVNGQRLNLNTFFDQGRGQASFDISGLVRWGTNTLEVQALGTPNATAKIAVEAPALTVRLLHINDTHGKLDPFPKIAAYVKDAKAQAVASQNSVFFIDAGDDFSGDPVTDLNKGIPMIEVLNASGLDLLAVGNHNFDYGPANTQARRVESEFPWLSANTVVVDQSLTPIEPFNDTFIYTTGAGQKIAFIALTETPPSTSVKNTVGLRFDDPLATAQAEVNEVRDQASLVVVVSHDGEDFDERLAAFVPGIDLIIGGHSHTYNSTPVVVNGVPIVQVGSNAQYLGDVLVRQAGTVAVTGGAAGGAYTVRVAGLTAVDPDVKTIVDGWNALMAPMLDAKIGYTPTEMNRDDRYIKDVSIGNLITDAMRSYMGTEIALTNCGGIRASIPAGDITMREVYTVLPFGNFVQRFNLTGDQIRQVIEYSYVRDNRFQLDLQTSGLTYTIFTKPGGGLDHVVLKVNGQPIDPNRLYSVAIVDYIGNGGSGYPIPSMASPLDLSSDVDAIIVGDFIKAIGNLSYPASEGRIVIKAVPTPMPVTKLNFYNSSSLLAADSGTLVKLTNQADVLVWGESTAYQYERSSTAPKNFVKIDAGQPIPLAALQSVGGGKVVGIGAILIANGYRTAYQNPQWFTNLLDFLTGSQSGTVLIDEGHGQYYDNTRLTQYRDFASDRGYTLTYTGKNVPLTAARLAGADVLVITTPGSVGVYTTDELAALNAWVAGGGDVVLMSQTDYNNNSNPTEMNNIAAGIGSVIRFDSDEVRDNTNKDGTANYSPTTTQFNPAYPTLLKLR